jgi:carbonic anhydrase
MSFNQSPMHGVGCNCAELMNAGLRDRRGFLRALAGGAMALGLAPFAALAAKGKYEAMLLSCIDPRFQSPIHHYMHEQTLTGQYSQFSIAGAAIGVVAPAFNEWHKTFWDNLGASVQLHSINRVIVINHRDCGAAKIAYGEAAVKDRATETATHQNALAQFRKELTARFPALSSVTGLMALDGTLETFS